MPNSIGFAKKYTGILDEVYQRAAVSNCLNSGGNMVRAGRNAKEILIPKIEVTGPGDYTRNVGYKTGSITWTYETHTFAYDRAIRLFADVMDVEEAGIIDCFVQLQRTQVAPEGDAYTFSEIASTEGVTTKTEDLSSATAEQLLASLRTVTSAMDEKQVSTGSRYLFITPTLNGVIQDFSYANPNRSNRVLDRFARVVEVPQVRFFSAVDLLSGDDDQFGYQKAAGTYVATTDTEVDSSKTYYTKSGDEYTAVASPAKSGLANYYELKGAGKDLNFMVVEKSAIIKYAKHVASRVFSPDELESLDSYMLKYRRYAICSVLENKLDGVYMSASTE